MKNRAESRICEIAATIIVLLAIAVLPTVSFAETVSYRVDPQHTYASFEIDHLGLSMARGSFNRTTGTIKLDLASGTGHIDIEIDAASIDTGLAKRDKHLRAPEFFNVEQFPKIRFVAASMQFEGGALIRADGHLTLLGKTLPVSLDVKRFSCGKHPIYKKPACGADAYTLIRRSQWGMTTYVPIIGDDVTIRIGVEAFAQP